MSFQTLYKSLLPYLFYRRPLASVAVHTTILLFYIYRFLFVVVVHYKYMYMQICVGFLLFVYICYWRTSYQEGRVVIPLASLTLPHFCACPKPDPGFPMPYVMVFFVFSELLWEVLVVLLILVELLTITVLIFIS